MFPHTFSSLSFGKVLNGISSTLKVVNQIIPIYNQAKPMIDNSKKIISAFKEITVSKNNSDTPIPSQNIEKKKTDNYLNLPVFFS